MVLHIGDFAVAYPEYRGLDRMPADTFMTVLNEHWAWIEWLWDSWNAESTEPCPYLGRPLRHIIFGNTAMRLAGRAA